MYRIISQLLTAILLLISTHTAFAETVLATIDIDVKKDYEAFLKGRDPLTITDFSGEHSRRDVAEVILMQQALVLGGFAAELNFRVVQGYDHSLQLVTAGLAVIRGSPLWGTDANRYQEELYISQNLVQLGDFNVGFYTSRNNKRALQSKDYNDLAHLTAISSRSWIIDWRTLKSLEFKQVKDVQTWAKMVEYVALGKADFTLAPFQSTDDLSLSVNEYQLIPIPNLKVTLDGTRHWIVSKQHPLGQQVFDALTKGINLMIEKGTVNKAYQESGFFHPAVSDWTIIAKE